MNGALVGGRIALIALGIALIYRANRIVNFAQGDLGAVPATLGVMLVVAWSWSYWFGLLVGLVASIRWAWSSRPCSSAASLAPGWC